ncbi:MAG: type II toxin-antitoxin system VapC family toxin [Candidatus Poribacteria bacterium]|nr:type II toxin-antitoxin system VapC family toxin [Candidatus Poribacteria bacterium]
MIYFFDSSAFVKRYVSESGSEHVRSLLAPDAENVCYIAHLTVVEVTAALHRRSRSGAIRSTDLETVLNDFRSHVRDYVQVYRITEELIERGARLASQHVLRGYDAMQLATALTLNERLISRELGLLTLVSSDNELNAVARAEGLVVIDPTE